MIAVICLIDMIGLSWFGWRAQSFGHALLGSLGLAMVQAFYIRVRPRPPIASLAGTVADFIAFSAAAAILSYLATALRFPLIDDTLAAIDDGLGMDWLGFYHWYKSFPLAIKITMNLAYLSDLIQLIILLVVFNFRHILYDTDKFHRGRHLIWCYALTALTSIVISGLFPAVGEFVRHGVALGTPYIPQFQGAYDGTLQVIDLATVEGIITFPSFHAALSVIFIISTYGIWPLFVPVLMINLIDVFSTPINGGHYFTDVLVGIVIAVFWISVLRYWPRHFRLVA
jgi:hypothetical protein